MIKKPFLLGKVLLACALVMGMGVVAAAEATAAPQPVVEGGRLLADTLAMYPRAIRLQHSGPGYDGRILVSINTGRDRDGNGTADHPTNKAAFYESVDDGRTFTRISELDVPETDTGRWSGQGSIFEFPQDLGTGPAGTLVWAVAVNDAQGTEPNRGQIRLWKSADHGRSWQFLSDCATAPTGRGLWEPELSVDGSGRLVCHYSDKSQQGYGQALAAARSSDGGLTWTERRNTVALNAAASPGMPTVRALPGGGYLMSYEYCDVAGGPVVYGCRVYVRESADGWNWGDPRDLGTPVQTADGKRLSHAPTLAVTGNGRVLLIAKYTREGSSIADSGRVMFANDDNGVGDWYEVDAPVRLTGFTSPAPDAEHWCKNYSPSLVPSADGTQVFEVTTDLVGDRCTAYFGTGRTISPPLRLMALGDSITEGIGGSDGRGYRGDLWQLLKADDRQVNFAGSNSGQTSDGRLPDVDHEGYGGHTVNELQTVLDNRDSLETHRPSHILLHIGTNDINRGAGAQTAANRLRTLLGYITGRLPQARIHLAKIVRFSGGAKAAEVNAYNSLIGTIAAEQAKAGKHVQLVDMSTALTDADMADTVHPNDSGYSKMAARWYESLNSTLLFRWEAEDPATTVLNNAQRITTLTNASGGGKVGHIDHADSSLEYTVGAPYTGDYRMFVRAGSDLGTSCSHALTVNGTALGLLSYPGYGWDRWSMTGVDVRLNAGGNTIRFAKGDCHAEIDSIDFTVGPRPETYQLANEASRLCLDVVDASTASGALLQQWACNLHGAQAWRLKALGGGYFALENRRSVKCAAIVGTQLQQVDCDTGSDAQKWLVTKTGTNPAAPFYTVRAKLSGHCMLTAGTLAGTTITTAACNGSGNQIWNLTPSLGRAY